MASGSGIGKVTIPGAVLGVLLFVFVLVSIWLSVADRFWFPDLASEHGGSVDTVYVVVLIVTGIAFVATQLLLAYIVTRYGARNGEKAAYWHENARAEAILIGGTAVTLTVLVFLGQYVWYQIYFTDPPEGGMVVEATGQQFQWVFRYPGDDGVFGDLDPTLVAGTNYIGLDRNGAGADDILVVGQMHAVADQPVRVVLRSTDVIHNFHLPHMRVKQDTVPGMSIEVWFTPTETGTYEVACAELCGLGHFRMSGMLIVDATQAEFDQWLEDQLVFQ